MRTRVKIGLAALLLAVTFASGLGLGAQYLDPLLGPQGTRMQGRLLAEAFHPRFAGACDTPDARDVARVAYAEGTRWLAKLNLLLSTPAVAERSWFAPPSGCEKFAERFRPNLIVNAGETALRDCFNANAAAECTATVAVFKYHGMGTGVAAAAEADTGCGTELTTQYNPDSTRATGSQTTNGANIYRTIGTNTIDAGTPAVTEWCLHKAATAAVTLWSRVVFAAINLAANDGVQFTYDLTLE